MKYSTLCETLLPLPVQEEMKQIDLSYNHAEMEPYWWRLLSPRQWKTGIEKLTQVLGEDPKGFRLLNCQLHCAMNTYRQYRQKGIPESIFWDTMKFIPRMLEWQKTYYGEYSFPWGWWLPRQLSLYEFRLGEFELERVKTEQGPVLSLHIPSGAKLEPELLRDSIRRMNRLCLAEFQDYYQAPVLCDSWMLSPALKELLPQDSRILKFANCFEVESVDWESTAVLDWVFPGPKVPYEQLAETTSLQRAMKQYLLQGNQVGWARGRLKEF